ncbi:MAG: NAD-binding protein [Deltaproteobacteria bacterium]|nr:NAD-binding protein [Deltaproteobacteria bacterium]MBN2688822.1 NAD-binding protein [Deltaproteobacteria bacterium]
MLPLEKVRFAFLLLILIFVFGTLGYHVLEGWPFLESFYATVVTLGTVGYGDFYPKSSEGRIFAIFLITFGVGTMAYTFALVMENFMEGRLKQVLGRGKLKKQISKMRDHYIVCGYGKIGRLICKELSDEGIAFIVVDNDEKVIQRVEDAGFIYVKGTATDDQILIEAGVGRARGLVSALPTDADNLYVVLTARELNHDLYVVARFEDEASERRLIKAGANRVISPYKVGGSRMTLALLRPAMLDFVEITTGTQRLSLRMEEIHVGSASYVIGKSLAESGLRREYDLIIVAVNKASGKMVFNPVAAYVIEKGDNLIAIGEEENLLRFSQACRE